MQTLSQVGNDKNGLLWWDMVLQIGIEYNESTMSSLLVETVAINPDAALQRNIPN